MHVDRRILQTLVEDGYLTCQEHPEGGLFIYNYTAKTQFENYWTPETLMCRGLIVDTAGEIIALPWPKFFNYGERLPEPGTYVVDVTEKLDGSLGILYLWKGQWWIATRGSFVSDQAQWATQWFRSRRIEPVFNRIASPWTLLFEIIYPENRVVVNYGDFEGLVLLGGRTLEGADVTHDWIDEIASLLGVRTPYRLKIHSVDHLLEAAKTLSANEEGWVVKYSDGSRFKIKGEAYKLAHKFMTGATYPHVLEAVACGQYDAMIEGVPDEFLTEVKAWKNQIDGEVCWIADQVSSYFEQAPKTSRKDFALWCKDNCTKTVQSMLFAMLDGKDIYPLIYKSLKERYRDGV